MTQSKKILMLGYYWYPELSVGTLRSRRFAVALKNAGWYVTAIVPDKGPVEEDHEFRVIRVKARDEKICEAIASPFGLLGLKKKLAQGLLWRTRKFFTYPDPGTFCNRWGSEMVKTALEIAKKEKFDVIWLTVPPFFLILSALKITQKCDIPVVLDVRDPWIHNFAFEYGGLREKRCYEYEKKVMDNVAALVCVTPGDAEIMRLRYPGRESQIHCISNGYEERYIPEPVTRQDDKFVVAILGQSYQGTPELLEGIEKACRLNSEFASRFILRWVGVQQGDKAPSDNYEFYPRCEQKKSLELVADADALWLDVPLGESGSYVIRSKTYEYLAMKKPVLGIAPSISCNRDVIDGVCNNRFIDSRSSDDVAELLLWAFDKFKSGEFKADTDESKLSQFEAKTLGRNFEAILKGITGIR